MKTSNKPNGTIYLKYTLKEDQEFTCNLDNDDARGNRILTHIVKAGEEVQINLSATLSGNYAELVKRYDNHTYRLNMTTEQANMLVTKNINKF